MSYFKMDISNIKESIEKYKNDKKNYEENLIIFYDSLENVDSCWSDVNVLTFMKNVKTDRNTLLNYIQSLDKVINDLSFFVEGLELIIKKTNYNGIVRDLKFDNNNYIEIKKKFNSVIYYLDDAMNQFNNHFINSNFSDMLTIYSLKNELKETISLTRLIMNKIDIFVKSIVKEINFLITKIGKIDNLKFEIDIMKYKSVIVDL